MAFIHFDQSYVPCGFLIVPDGGDPYSEATTVLVQSDWDYPAIAGRMGLEPCTCGATDGTTDCPHKTASDMIHAAFVHIGEHAGELFVGLDDYLPASGRATP